MHNNQKKNNLVHRKFIGDYVMDDNDFKFKMMPNLFNSVIDDIENKILSPLFYMKEFDSCWILEFDLPLVNEKDIQIIFDKNTVSVRAKLKEEYSQEKFGHITKFEYFKKTISLPEKIDNKKTNTSFQKGRLMITIEKIL